MGLKLSSSPTKDWLYGFPLSRKLSSMVAFPQHKGLISKVYPS
ncbi:hypothetical protein HMPREF9999_00354 [Alloprevotella sp. oral taxon 473 str. F0040]|nr:hypothetical protein HMPREF9999_00354 [Alloprevotella sp. oral taxon 473 str. F0040]